MIPKQPLRATDGTSTVDVSLLTVDSGAIGENGNITISGATPGTDNVGYLNIPQNIQAVDYTTVLTDAGKHIYHASGAGAGDAYTIAANASVAYEIGTAITFVNMATDNITVDIATDTLNYADTGAVTTITIPQYNMVTAIKITTTSWLASGTAGVTTA